jgi:hypothetical protein
MVPTTTTMVPTTTTMVPTTTTMVPTTTTILPITTTMLPTMTTMVPTTTTIKPLSEYYNIIDNPTYEQVQTYIFKYLTSKDYRAVGKELFFNIYNVPPLLIKDNTGIIFETIASSDGYGFFSTLYSKLFIDKAVLKNVNYTNLNTIIISKLIFNVTINQVYTNITKYAVFDVSSIATTTEN